MELVDVHCHLENDFFQSNLDETLSFARRAGVRKLITASAYPAQWSLSAELARRYEAVEFAVGIHPWYCPESVDSHLASLASAALGAVAIGEIGLDAKTQRYPMARQLDILIPQLELARDLELPVVLHCRGAFNELLMLLRKYGPERGGVVHNFSGSPELAEELIQHGFSFSMGGVLTWRNSPKRARLLRAIYRDHFMLETDAPDIPPVEARGTPNTPANILYVLRAASEILERPAEEIAAMTTRNAARLFDLHL